MRKTGALLLAAVSFSSCGEQKSSERDRLVVTSGESTEDFDLPTPLYGHVVQISGMVFFGPEAQDINICVNGEEKCKPRPNVDGSPQPCWLEFTSSANDDIRRLKFDIPMKDGEYLFRGQGRIAVRPGQFGHLNMYTCQVELKHVTKISPQWPFKF